MATLPQRIPASSIFLNTKCRIPKLFCRPVRNCLPRSISFQVNGIPRVSVKSFRQIFSLSTQAERSDKVSKYLFRTEIGGGTVNVLVRKENLKCVVRIEVSSLQFRNNDDRLILNWGAYRADSSQFLPLELGNPPHDDRTFDIPFFGSSVSGFSVDLEIEEKLIPCYLSFLLKSPANDELGVSEIRSHRKMSFCVPIGFGSGYATPLGLSFSRDGATNFSVVSREAESVVLCLYDDTAANNPVLELELDPYVNRTGDVWHASFQAERCFTSYDYRLRKRKDGSEDPHGSEDSHLLQDPYAKIVEQSTSSDSGTGPDYLGRVLREPVFDWGNDVCPNLSLEKLMIYRVNVKRFTEHKSSQLPPDIAGTFAGLSGKLKHLINLGVNTILLEPVSVFDEKKGPYFPVNFFSPTNQYGPTGSAISAIDSMKEMVKTMHKNGIEVLMEVVFTHTGENGALREVNGSSYYRKGRNTLNCDFPVVQQLILDSLRYWATEFRIDGFCFINAPSLLCGSDGNSLSRPSLIEMITFDPVLSKTKIIADFWDPNENLPAVKTRFPHWKRWAEMNARFCVDVRKFLRGEGILSELATRLCGSGDVFSDRRGPSFSFNYVTGNSGLSLVDLVSFSGEALDSELSWNCGIEGPTNQTIVLERRVKQIRNFLFILYISHGIPVLNMGDECGQSAGGSPAYSDRKPYDWNALKTDFAVHVTQFISFLTSLRQRRSDLLQKRFFSDEESIQWFGSDQSPPKWDDPTCRFLAMSLTENRDDVADNASYLEGDLFVAFNGADREESLVLPTPEIGFEWRRLVDTALVFPGFFSSEGEPVIEDEQGSFGYEMKSLSCALFEAKRK